MFNSANELVQLTLWQHEPPRRVFAIGDIHGEYKVAHQLRDFIDFSLGITASDLIVFNGDYIDRGPDVRETVEIVMDICERYPAVALFGNHEDSFKAAFGLSDRTCDRGDDYLFMYQGISTIASYLGMQSNDVFDEDYDDLSQFAHLLPAAHVQFFQSLKEGLLLGNYLFTHAPCGCDQKLEQLTLNEVLRGKRGECDEDGNYPHLLVSPSGERLINVHGHVSLTTQHVCDYRIGIDTACGKNPCGFLTMVEIRPGSEMSHGVYETFYHFNKNGRISNPSH